MAFLGASTWALDSAQEFIEDGLFTMDDYKKADSTSWLIAAPIIFAQCMKNDSIVVIPLVKAGRPIMSGMNVGSDPMSAWINTMGKMRNKVGMAVEGAEEIVDEWWAYKTSIWQFAKSSWDGNRGLESFMDTE